LKLVDRVDIKFHIQICSKFFRNYNNFLKNLNYMKFYDSTLDATLFKIFDIYKEIEINVNNNNK
jgi:hypothetical protein